MKKIYRIAAVLLAALMMVAMFAACGAQEETPVVDEQPQVETDNTANETDDTADVSEESALAAAYENIAELNLLPAMIELNDAYVEAYYGISADAMADKVFAIAEDALLADTIIAVKVSASGDAAAIESAFKSFNEQKKLELESYNPVQYDRVCNAAIVTDGEYVFYIVSDNNDAVLDTFLNTLGL